MRKVSILWLAPCAISGWAFRSVDFLWLEALLFSSAVLFAVLAGNRLQWTAHPPAWCRGLRRLSRSTPATWLTAAIASVAVRACMLPWIPIPHPVVPDEFSHLLLAKTLLLGRLANPAHPLWQHFESIHILSRPTYSSMYMAGQACFLALGKLLFGNFFWGVLLSTALFCGTVTWFLRAYVPPGWALFGGLLTALRIGAASYWNNSYWGGSAGALGGAMALGAYPRLTKAWAPLPALIFSSGLALLAATRPWEGAVLGIVLVAGLVREYFLSHPQPARIIQALAIMAVTLTISGWAMTTQWKAATGDRFLLPYQVNQRIYGWPMTLPWIPVRQIHYTHPEFALYHDFEIGEHRSITNPPEIPVGFLVRYSSWWRFFFGIALSPVFLFTTRIVRRRRERVLWLAGGATALAVMTEQSAYPHYWAPAAPLVLLFIIQGLRRLTHCHIGYAATGPAIVRFALPVFACILVVHAVTMQQIPAAPPPPNFISWCCNEAGYRDREPIVKRLEAIPGDHLVILRYDLKAYDTLEWVYNEPDIDHARIVWARDMGQAQNEALLRYYPNRRVWQVRITKDHAAALTRLR